MAAGPPPPPGTTPAICSRAFSPRGGAAVRAGPAGGRSSLRPGRKPFCTVGYRPRRVRGLVGVSCSLAWDRGARRPVAVVHVVVRRRRDPDSVGREIAQRRDDLRVRSSRALGSGAVRDADEKTWRPAASQATTRDGQASGERHRGPRGWTWSGSIHTRHVPERRGPAPKTWKGEKRRPLMRNDGILQVEYDSSTESSAPSYWMSDTGEHCRG